MYVFVCVFVRVCVRACVLGSTCAIVLIQLCLQVYEVRDRQQLMLCAPETCPCVCKYVYTCVCITLLIRTDLECVLEAEGFLEE